MLPIGNAKTFKEYATKVFIPFVKSPSQNVSRVDFVWDVYLDNSLKATTRNSRGAGARRRVAANTAFPGSWQQFLRVDENKNELFRFLANYIADLAENEKVITSTYGEGVLCNTEGIDFTNISPCTHEEADTRLLLHAADAVSRGLRKVIIRTVDTDVVCLAIAYFERINS